ncbi:hypothetical protein [Leptothoe kymatousa]|uniref:Uncharacterized protein n=1 Tax=Leptothoe kymatousa TAU-MAC 1615 TaxID=2364775 RepID=A0ABS5Y5F2_9CYAN|nr:hypothetical protein [Leptothoe kymatousa]MBT9313069.1 hypothetical protein [Leptothoe kymatousa TAU-MAC 1615]
MNKFTLALAFLLATSASSAQANSACYMEMNGRHMDLGYMCGDGASSSAPLPPSFVPTESEYVAPDYEIFEVVEESNPVSFELIRSAYNRNNGMTTITGYAVFPRSSEYGDWIQPTIYDRRNGSMIAIMPTIERTRGQRKITATVEVPGQVILKNLEARL